MRGGSGAASARARRRDVLADAAEREACSVVRACGADVGERRFLVACHRQVPEGDDPHGGPALDHREAVLANDAHMDPRSIQIPGTPFEPESMVIVPLMAEGEVLGTLNIGRMGEAEAAFCAVR